MSGVAEDRSPIPFKILICCTGSVASVKIPLLVSSLKGRLPGSEIRLAPTRSSLHFFKECEITELAEIYKDELEWSSWQKLGDPVLHIELSKWADVLVLAPLDANTLGKLANGLCDNLVTCIARAWDFGNKKPAIFCPAMNTKMWDHPVTSYQIGIIESWGYKQIAPISKLLACGDKGIGAMAEVSTIVDTVCSYTLSSS